MQSKKLTEGDLQQEANLRGSVNEKKSLEGRYLEENTFVILKPESLIRGIAGQIISRFEDKGLRITALDYRNLGRSFLEKFYSHIKHKHFFGRIVHLMTRGPVIGMVIRGHLAIDVVRSMIGPTDPTEALGGTIRGDFATSLEEGNVIHASDSEESYLRELRLFSPELFE